MYGKMKEDLQRKIEYLREKGFYKNERVLVSPQGA